MLILFICLRRLTSPEWIQLRNVLLLLVSSSTFWLLTRCKTASKTIFRTTEENKRKHSDTAGCSKPVKAPGGTSRGPDQQSLLMLWSAQHTALQIWIPGHVTYMLFVFAQKKNTKHRHCHGCHDEGLTGFEQRWRGDKRRMQADDSLRAKTEKRQQNKIDCFVLFFLKGAI